MFAADVGAGRAQFVADEIRQQVARLAQTAAYAAIERQRDALRFALPHGIA
jgi:hypothetical protein